MRVLASVAGVVLLLSVLLDAFQSIILPRRPVGRFRITRVFFLITWSPWRLAALALQTRKARDQFYSIYGPLSLLVLFVLWALLLTGGFGLVFFGMRVPFKDPMLHNPAHWARLRSCLYVSGTTLFTLGLGDVLPTSHAARLMTVVEAGTGLGFVALVIGYVPLLYTAFSHREVLVALLDARAGSPPSAAELLSRHAFDGGIQELKSLLAEWERWCAEMLETHISYPILCYYRSQHDNQSWLSALTTVLDVCSLMIASSDGRDTRQAQLTFAIGRHTLVDLVHVFHQESVENRFRGMPLTRLPDDELARLCTAMNQTELSPCNDLDRRSRLYALRMLYEPSACALAEHLRLSLPLWAAPALPEGKNDAWKQVAGLRLPAAQLTHHVSSRATAANLDVHDREPE